MGISSFYKNKLGANLVNKGWSWGAFNPDTNQLFLRVWEHQLKNIDSIECSLILDNGWGQKSLGFLERKRHVDALRNGVKGYGVVCTAKDQHTSGNQKIGGFDNEFLLKFGELFDEINGVYAQIISRIPVKDLARTRTPHSYMAPDLKSIIKMRKDETTKKTLTNARLGQGEFRTRVLYKWGLRCCVTGSTTLDAVRASHIKPWRDSSDSERLDPNNGLPLIATLDALFDSGLIAFSSDGVLMISRRLDAKEIKILGIAGLRLIQQPNAKTVKFLAYHRENIFADD